MVKRRKTCEKEELEERKAQIKRGMEGETRK
jgi:hypothetical protein